jgi:hypothetical protein
MHLDILIKMVVWPGALTMKRIKYQILWVVFFVSATSAAGQSSAIAGQPPELAALRQLLDAKAGRTDSMNDPKWRASLATALHRYCQSVLMQVPRNTPAEDQWVDGGLRDSGNVNIDSSLDPQRWDEHRQRLDNRIERVVNSVAFARQALRKGLSKCSSLTNDLVELKQPSSIVEALLWVRLSRLFSIGEIIWAWADRVGLMSENGCRSYRGATLSVILKGDVSDAHDENDLCFWDYIGTSIIDHAVIPLLEGQ